MNGFKRVVAAMLMVGCGAPVPLKAPVVEPEVQPEVQPAAAPSLELTLSPTLVTEGGAVVVMRMKPDAVLTQELHRIAPGTRTLTLLSPPTETLGLFEHGAVQKTVVRSRVQQAGCQAAPLVSSEVLRVPEDFSGIQAAIDAALPGDTVLVGPGVFTESVHLRTGISLRGSGAGQTILDAQGAARTLVDFTDAANVSISGFTFRGVGLASTCGDDVLTCSGNWYAAAIAADGHAYTVLPSSTAGGELPICPGSSAHISHNVFDGNAVAVMPYFHALAVVQNNLFVNNTHAYVANHLQDQGVVIHNTFVGSTQHAIAITAGYVDVVDNVVAGSTQSAMFQEYIQRGRVQCNLVSGRDPSLPMMMTVGVDGNLEADPRFVDFAQGDFHLGAGSPGLDTGCDVDLPDVDGSLPDLGAWGGPAGQW